MEDSSPPLVTDFKRFWCLLPETALTMSVVAAARDLADKLKATGPTIPATRNTLANRGAAPLRRWRAREEACRWKSMLSVANRLRAAHAEPTDTLPEAVRLVVVDCRAVGFMNALETRAADAAARLRIRPDLRPFDVWLLWLLGALAGFAHSGSNCPTFPSHQARRAEVGPSADLETFAVMARARSQADSFAWTFSRAPGIESLPPADRAVVASLMTPFRLTPGGASRLRLCRYELCGVLFFDTSPRFDSEPVHGCCHAHRLALAPSGRGRNPGAAPRNWGSQTSRARRRRHARRGPTVG